MASLCVVTNSDEVVELPLKNHSDQCVYDSCANGAHNIIPSLDVCQEQWVRYLGDGAIILNEDTLKVKQTITEVKDDINRFVTDLC